MMLVMYLAQAANGLFPGISDENKFWLIALVVALFAGGFWLMNRNAEKWLDANGRDDGPQNDLDWLLREKAEAENPPALKYSEQEFKEMVAKALDEIPEEFEKEWENVAVTVSTGWPTETEKKRMGVAENHLLFGVYSGASRLRGSFARNFCPERDYDLPASAGTVLRLRQSSLGAGGTAHCAARTCASSWDDTREDEGNWIVRYRTGMC